jgi:hypothetical protein
MLVFHCLLVLSLETGNWELGHVPHSGDFPFRERENNHVPVVLNPSFSNIPRTTFPFLDPIDPGTWLVVTKALSKSFALEALVFVYMGIWVLK